MDEAWPQGEHTYQLTMVPRKLIEEVTLVHANMNTLKRAARHAQTPQHLFFIITMLSAGGKVGLCYSAAAQPLSV